MNHRPRILLFAALLALAATDLTAGDSPVPVKPSTDPAVPSSEASTKESYPLTTCVVSGEPLDAGHAGGSFDYLHKEAGKPDRLVRFCCKACLKDFKKDPAKYLAKIDAAAAATVTPPAR